MECEGCRKHTLSHTHARTPGMLQFNSIKLAGPVGQSCSDPYVRKERSKLGFSRRQSTGS